MSEAEIKSLIKNVIKQELKDINKEIDNIKKTQNSFTSEDEVRKIVRETIVNMYKFLWQKSNTYIRQI